MYLTDAKWIWLNEDKYPEYQKNRCTVFGPKNLANFAIAEFQAQFPLKAGKKTLHIEVCGDTKFWLYEGGQFIGMGPVCPGGDFGCERAMLKYYACRYDLEREGDALSFFARVQLSPEVQADASCGRGGFILRCEVEYADGTKETFVTDDAWQARLNRAWSAPVKLDMTVAPDEWHQAAVVESVWNLYPSPIPMLAESEVYPAEPIDLCVSGNEAASTEREFNRIYSAYAIADIEADGPAEITLTTWETPGQDNETEVIVTDRPMQYRSLRMMSAGGMTVTARSLAGGSVRVKNAGLMFARYPVSERGSFRCSDPALDKIWDVGRWTLEICRQWIHLDSPKHQESLGCTGDYYIESLMNWFAFGDARLTRFDIVRTADWMRQSGGFMFHTTYSLIWVRMMRDYFLHTGDRTVFQDTRAALDVLMARFHGYLGENGLIEHAPNYMFVDWRELDGCSMHHPPKALGQTCLNAFYYQALRMAAEIMNELGEHAQAAVYAERAAKLKVAFNENFFDAERGLYLSGLNTPGEVNAWQMANVSKRFYSKHASALAVYAGLCEGDLARAVMEKVMTDDTLIDFQPYFAHFVLDALDACGLFAKYGLTLIDRWKPMIEACDKGMQEGWIKPGNNYGFDHSHAWGGTPTYQLPCRILGLKILAPGMKKIALAPDLMGLAWAEIEMPTPLGMLTCRLERGKAPEITAPKGMQIEMR